MGNVASRRRAFRLRDSFVIRASEFVLGFTVPPPRETSQEKHRVAATRVENQSRDAREGIGEEVFAPAGEAGLAESSG
jgi:hypothetical protein